VIQPGLAPQQLALPGTLITLGRANDCTVPIKDRFLSRRHAEIAADDVGGWILRDCGSVNGTLLNGLRLLAPQALRPGDRIGLGDSEVIFNAADDDTSHIVATDTTSHATNMIVAVDVDERGNERTQILNALAVEFLADRPMAELFDFIINRVVELLAPSRAAIATIGGDKMNFENVRLRRSSKELPAELRISRTLLQEVVDGRKVVSFFDHGGGDDRLANAESIIAQRISSAICAPLLVGDDVLGVLYLDFIGAGGAVTENDLRLVAQIARFAAVTLERTRLREEALAKAKIDEELRTAYVIQSRLLPAQLPTIDGYRFAGTNRPCKTVSGDYYDVVVRPDGRIYFVIADVSGKGITAALVMSSVATAFQIFTRSDPTPADLVREINATLAPKTTPTKFVTLFAGVLDPARGVVDFANGGHVPPLVIGANGVQTLKSTDLVVGLFADAQYRNQSVTLERGDSLVMFTDGVTEAENAAEEQLGLEPVAEILRTMHGSDAARILDTIDERVRTHTGDVPAGDDVTMLALTRL
jgi:serine phosphatase RsbU (regulator of sigma subunit)/pSer/pThr/pTyr-binding forkhead associated (FHA) protein